MGFLLEKSWRQFAAFVLASMFTTAAFAAGSVSMQIEHLVRQSGDITSIDMVGLYEVGASGQFSSAVFYFDSAKAKALADLAK